MDVLYPPTLGAVDAVAGLEAFRVEARAWLEAHAPKRDPADIPVPFSEATVDLEESRTWQRLLAEEGWAGISWPTEYGGRGLGPVHEIVWAQEAARYRLPTDVFQIGLGMAGPTLITWGGADQKRRWLPPLLRGDEIWCQLFSEPAAGSDLAGVKTRAVRRGNGWAVEGEKVWTSVAHLADWGLLLARTDPEAPRHRGLTYFVIDMRQPGVEIRPLVQMTGTAGFNQVFFDGAWIPDDGVIGEVGAGWTVALTTLMYERLAIGRALIGVEGAFEAIVDRLRRAEALARPTIRSRTVDLFVRGEVLRFMTQRLIARLAGGEIPTAEGSAAKLGLADLVIRAGSLVVDALGPAEATDRWSSLFLAGPGMRIAGGTDEILKNALAERVLGLPREPRPEPGMPVSGSAPLS